MTAINKLLIASALSTITIIAYAVAHAQTSPSQTTPSTTETPTTTTTTTTPVTPSTGGKDLSGNYKCSGYDPYDKTNYSENIVMKKTGDTYSVQLIHDDSVVPYNLGTAVVNADVPNALSLVYWDPQKPSTMGTELFEIKSDGSLDGVWTSSGTKLIGTEVCTKS